MATVLITGSTAAVNDVAEAVRAEGGEPLICSPEELDRVVDGLPAGSLKHYVQMPVRVEPNEQTVTGRIRAFLEGGLLARYRTVEKVLPVLADDACVVIVAGNFLKDPNAPDDRAARLSLVHVLEHTIQADRPSPDLTVQVADPGTPIERVAAAAVRGERLERAVPRTTWQASMGYEDWRLEMMGIVGGEF